MSQKQKGVTLVEIMIAMGILAVIAAIAMPAYRGYIQSSREAEGWNNLAAIKLAQEEYFLENNRYFPDPDGTASTTASNLSAYWSPSETGANRNFEYTVISNGTGTSYTATATGRNKVPATTTLTVNN
jgi:type IV pilus assembly protein PilE